MVEANEAKICLTQHSQAKLFKDRQVGELCKSFFKQKLMREPEQ